MEVSKSDEELAADAAEQRARQEAWEKLTPEQQDAAIAEASDQQ
jgi:hypothetical protein